MYTTALGTVRSLYKCTQGRARPRKSWPKPYGPSTWQEMSQGKALHFHRSTAKNGKVVGGLGPEQTLIVHRAWMHSRVQWFLLFFTFWGITIHPWHPKGPRIWKLAKKNFQLHPWPAEIFGKNRKMRFLGLVSKFNFRSPVWQIFTIFSACFIYGILNTYIKF